jgi:hypothetical protein
MPLNAFFDGMDNVTTAGQFFVALTQRLGEGKVLTGEDALRLAEAFGIELPAELEGVSIATTDEAKDCECDSALTETEKPRTRVVITYPPVDGGPGKSDATINKCFTVCKTTMGVKVCAKVCVNITVGLGGISGKITATVSPEF